MHQNKSHPLSLPRDLDFGAGESESESDRLPDAEPEEDPEVGALEQIERLELNTRPRHSTGKEDITLL